MNYFLPILVVLKSGYAFFIVISFAVMLSSVLYIKKFPTIAIKERIFRGISLLMLVIHHFCFLVIYLTDCFNDKLRSDMVNACLISGIIVIFTVIIGILV